MKFFHLLFAFFFSGLMITAQAQNKRIKDGIPHNIIIILNGSLNEEYVAALKLQNHDSSILQRADGAGYIPSWIKGYPYTDNAGRLSVISTGKVCLRGSLGIDSKGSPAQTLFELAAKRKKVVGLITSTTLGKTDALAFCSHYKEHPNEDTIANQIESIKLDYLSCGGLNHFKSRPDKKDIINQYITDIGATFEPDITKLKRFKTPKMFSVVSPESLLIKDLFRNEYFPTETDNAIRHLISGFGGYVLVIDQPYVEGVSDKMGADNVKKEMEIFEHTLETINKYGLSQTLVLIIGGNNGHNVQISGATPEKGKIEIELSARNKSDIGMIPFFAIGVGADRFYGIQDAQQIHRILSEYINE